MHRSAVAVCIVSLCLSTAFAGGEKVSGAITGDGVALRAGPGTNHPVMKRLNKGDSVTVLGQEGEWVKVAARAFVGRKYVEKINATQGRVTSSGLYVRSQPNMDKTSQVRTVGRNHVFEVVGVRGAWLEVATHAYVHQNYVQQVIELDEIVVTAPAPNTPPPAPVLEVEPLQPLELEPLQLDPIEVPAPVIQIDPPVIDLPSVTEGDPVPAATEEAPELDPAVLPPTLEGDPVPPSHEAEVLQELDGELTEGDLQAGNPLEPTEVLGEEELDLQAGDPLEAIDADAPPVDLTDEVVTEEPADMTPELEEQILQDLLTLPLDDAYELHGEDNPNFQDRAEFDSAVQELRELATEEALPAHEIDGTYRLEPGFWLGRKPEVVIEVKQAQSGGNDFVVLHKVYDRKKQKVEGQKDKQVVSVLRYTDQAIGTWNPEKRRLEVEFPATAGAAGRLSGADDSRIRGRYTIHTTGEIRGTYKRENRDFDNRWENEWTCSSKGWRDGSIVSVGGYYELKPSWYAFGYKPTVKVWLDPQADGTFAVRREVHEKDGRILACEGVGQLDAKDDREVVVDFGSQHPPIRYEVSNDGRISSRYSIPTSHSYSALRSVDRRGESRSERGFRDGIEIDKFPTGLRVAWAKTKVLFVKGGKAVGRFGKMVGTKTWGATKWTARKVWGATKWTAGKVWDGTKWVAARVADGAQWVWDGTQWVAVKAWDGTKWVALKLWDGTKWVGRGIAEGGRRAWGATKAVGSGFREGGKILLHGVPADEADTAPVERLPIDDDGKPVVDIELGGEEQPVEGDPVPAVPAGR
ncbi:MAG: SH3 domain-containing protein [Planctomycetes bacterium]|nr:SH3 domain-containing protein [Planctomycetota bacterium]